jgi:hypothetical protein
MGTAAIPQNPHYIKGLLHLWNLVPSTQNNLKLYKENTVKDLQKKMSVLHFCLCSI